MARTVDPERHLARRLVIIDAALTCFAAHGYAGTSTAAICRQAGIGSGTFFHYFPTKQQVLLAILDLGTAETAGWFAGQDATASPRSVLDAYVRHAVEEFADPRVAGFVRAVGAVMGEPEIEAALARDAHTLQEGLEPWVARAQEAGEVRTDLSPRDLTAWLLLVLDGFLGRLATDPDFTTSGQGAALKDAVARLLAHPVVEQDGRPASGPASTRR
jgi:AcrR family transcriptional regulator